MQAYARRHHDSTTVTAVPPSMLQIPIHRRRHAQKTTDFMRSHKGPCGSFTAAVKALIPGHMQTPQLLQYTSAMAS